MLRISSRAERGLGNRCFPGAVRNIKIWLATKLNMIPNICMPSLVCDTTLYGRGHGGMLRDRRVRYVLPIGKRPAYCGPLVLHSDVCTVDRLSVLDRPWNTDITKMHGKRLQWVPPPESPNPPVFPDAGFLCFPFLKILVYAALMVTARRASRTGTRSCGPKHRPLLCNAVHCAPYSPSMSGWITVQS